MTTNTKLRVLHLWKSEDEAERLVRQLAQTGMEFEATLVKSEAEYVSLLARRRFDLVIVDERVNFHSPGPDHLSALEIAREIAPGVPLVMIGERGGEAFETGPSEGGVFPVPRCELEMLGPLLRKLPAKSITDSTT